jgi:alkanesulfonate monooxygenase SsuD/methylene tetrahydromethanopterin reductase-like flavin-dependent oxidoreductase (luciferase family)
LRAVARVGDACNIFGDPKMVEGKFDVLRQHCEKQGRDYNEIEKTNTTALLIAPNEAALQMKKEHYGIAGGYRGNALTPAQAIDWVGQFQKIGVQTFIFSAYKNDQETLELFASDVMPSFA